MNHAGAAQVKNTKSAIIQTKVCMKTPAQIVDQLRTEGHRITPIRGKILEFLSSSKSPISAPDLIYNFKSADINVNKTTIYRELEFLLQKQLINEVEFGDGKKRYEMDNGHHHHLVCLNCSKVEDVNLDADLSGEQKKIEKETGFKIKSHSLEFFGYCKDCQKSL